MAYEKHTWTDGEVITAERMNALEDGVENEQVGPRDRKGIRGIRARQVPRGPKVTQVRLDSRAPRATLARQVLRALKVIPARRALRVRQAKA